MIWLTERSELITETIRPADDDRDGDDRGRPDDADDAIEAALQLRLVEFRDAPGEHRQLAGLFAQAAACAPPSWASAAVSVSASDSLPPWRTRSTMRVQTVRSLVVAIMSTRMRSVVVSGTPLARRTPRLRQNKVVR